MKFLIVAAVLVLLAAVLYRVLRPIIKLALQFIKAIRHFQRVAGTPARTNGAVQNLVQCETCGVWIPQTRMLSAGSLTYCSRECLKLANRTQRKNTSA